MSVPSELRKSGGARKIRCLVIQMTRLGDTLQSLMALRAAKQLYPSLEIHFLARERFAAAAQRVPWIENVIVLPTEKLLGPALSGKKTEAETLGDLARWIAPLVKEPWDLVVNWSYSESSSYLTGLLPARVKLGYTRRRKDITFACAEGWSHYIQAIVQGGIGQNIHLTDILTTQLLTALQIHWGEPMTDGNSPVTSKSFFTLQLDQDDLGWCWRDLSRKWIAIQLGAGHESKTWMPSAWAALATRILNNHPDYGIVLLGGKEDATRAREFLAQVRERNPERSGVLSLVGASDFDLWASVIGSCQWLFSGDTAAIHLASVLGTRVFNVSVGPVRWSETGPYGNGHYVIASNLPCSACGSRQGQHSCRTDVTPETAYAAWAYAATEWSHRRQTSLEEHFVRSGLESELKSVQIFRSKIRHTNDGGGVFYEPIIRRPLRLEQWTALVMGHIARAWYCGWVPPVGQELSREMISPQLIQSLRELDESSQVLSKVCAEAALTATQLFKHAQRLRSEKVMGIRDREELGFAGNRLLELDDLIDRLGKTHSPLQCFAQMSKVLMHNLRSEHLADMGQESADCYRQLAEGVSLLRDWLKHTLDLAKPVRVRPLVAVPPAERGP